MLLVACVDSVNEQGISAIRKLRSDYFDYAPKKRSCEVYEFTGSFDITAFFKRSAGEQQTSSSKGAESKKLGNASGDKDRSIDRPSDKETGTNPPNKPTAPAAPKGAAVMETTEQRREESTEHNAND